jgi:hypothetical protein
MAGVEEASISAVCAAHTKFESVLSFSDLLTMLRATFAEVMVCLRFLEIEYQN